VGITIAVSIIGFLGGGWALITTLLNNRTLRALERDKVDAQAYQRAKEIYESGLQEMSRQVKFLQDVVQDERQNSQAMRMRIADLENVMSKMRTQMMLSGITNYDFDQEMD